MVKPKPRKISEKKKNGKDAKYRAQIPNVTLTPDLLPQRNKLEPIKRAVGERKTTKMTVRLFSPKIKNLHDTNP